MTKMTKLRVAEYFISDNKETMKLMMISRAQKEDAWGKYLMNKE